MPRLGGRLLASWTKKAGPGGTRFYPEFPVIWSQALPVALSTLIVTPGPMVELRATFFM